MRRRRTRNKEERRRLELQRRRRDESRRERMEEDETGEHVTLLAYTMTARSGPTSEEIEAYIVREFRHGTLRSGVVIIKRQFFSYNVERFIYVIGTIIFVSAIVYNCYRLRLYVELATCERL